MAVSEFVLILVTDSKNTHPLEIQRETFRALQQLTRSEPSNSSHSQYIKGLERNFGKAKGWLRLEDVTSA